MKPRRQISIADIIPSLIPTEEGSRLGMGLDIATTEKKKSNPSSLALIEQVKFDFVVRFLLRWKTKDPDVTRGIITAMLQAIGPRRVRKLSVDATNEKFFASDLKKDLGPMVPTELVVSSEKTKYLGEEMLFKVYLGNLLINTMEDGHLALADEVWIKEDFRLVKHDRGTFTVEVDSAGNHADSFDAVKLGLHSLIGAGGGPAVATAAQVGSYGGQPSRPSLNPFAYLFNKIGGRINV